MTKPRPRLFFGLMVCMLLTAFVIGASVLEKRLTSLQPKFDRIIEGTTQAEVEEVLGFPPGDYRSRPGFNVVGPGNILKPAAEWTKRPYSLQVWYFDEGHVEVIFDRDGEAAGKYWQADSYQPSLGDRLRIWLGL
jgi:hypothetical protein